MLQNLVGVFGGLYFFINLFDHTSFVNDVGGAHNAHIGFAVHFLFLPYIIGLDNLGFRVGEQQKGQLILRGKIGVRAGAVLADANDNRAQSLKFRIRVPESAGLGGAALCIVLGIKIKNNLFSFKIRKADRMRCV